MRAFSNVHPIVLIIFFLSVLLISMFTWHPVLLLSALASGICFTILLERGHNLGRNIAFYLPMFILIAVTNPLFSHNGETPLFFMNGNAVTWEAIVYGISIAIMLVAVMLWCKCYTIIMTSDKFLYLFGSIIPHIALILSISIRFIPQFKDQIKRVSYAQKAMGLYTSDSYLDKLGSAFRVFSVMITWSLESAVETGNCMKARGYGLKGRTHFSLFRFRKEDGILLTYCIVCIGIALLGVAFKSIPFYFYPRISGLTYTLPAILTYSSFFALAFMPCVYELKENLKWKYYVSKI